MYYMPTEAAIQQVMRETGMERMQAIRHLQGRHMVQQSLARQKTYPLGKSAELA